MSVGTMPATPRQLLQWLRERILIEGSQTARREWLPMIVRTLTYKPDDSPQQVYVQSLLSARDHVGRVELQLGDATAQMPPGQARDVATMLMEAALAAEQDQFLYEWVRDDVGAEDEKAAALVGDFRDFRVRKATEWAAERVILEPSDG